MKYLAVIALGAVLSWHSPAMAQSGSAPTKTLKTRCVSLLTNINNLELFAHFVAAPPDTEGTPVMLKSYLNHESESLEMIGDQVVFTTSPSRSSASDADQQVAKLKIPSKLRSAIFLFLPGGESGDVPKFQILPIDDSTQAFPLGAIQIINLSAYPLRVELEKKPFDVASSKSHIIKSPPVGDSNASTMRAFSYQNNEWKRIAASTWPHPGKKRVIQVAYGGTTPETVIISGIRDIAGRTSR